MRRTCVRLLGLLLLTCAWLSGCRVVLDQDVVAERQSWSYERGLLVVDDRWFEGSRGMHRIPFDGRPSRSWPTSGTPVLAPDGRLAWVRVTVSEASRPGPTKVVVAAPSGRIVAEQRLRPGIVQAHGFVGDRVVFSRWYRQGVFITDLEHRPVRLRWWPRRETVGPVSPDGELVVGYRGRWVVVHEVDGGDVVAVLPRDRSWAGVAWISSHRVSGVVPPPV